MKVQRLRLKGFKRFDDLTIELGKNPARIVALVGPNGSGKSSIFDAFEELQKDVKGAQRVEPPSFFSKFMYHPDEAQKTQGYDEHQAIELSFENGQTITKKTFHLRSAYRFTPTLNVERITAQPDILEDGQRPHSSIALDSRLRENYERLNAHAYGEFARGEKNGNQVRAELLDRINDVLNEVLDVRVSSLGNVMERKGQLFFEKTDAKNFPYQNLSAGEKEVIDIVVDLVVRSKEFDDTVYGIDEPELHLNTSIQRKLLVAMERIIPPNCQLWVATHSIGFLRALQDELAEKCAVLDFSEKPYFVGAHTITPIEPCRANWQRMFATALDDLVGLLAPERIIYCEGRQEPNVSGDEQGLDALVYNEVFSSQRPATLFVSAGGGGNVAASASIALRVLQKAFKGMEVLLLHDCDDHTEDERAAWLRKASHHRMLKRRELENYLFDVDVLSSFCEAHGRVLDKERYSKTVRDVIMQDLKREQQQLQALCGEPHMKSRDFKLALACHVRGTRAGAELRDCVFGARTASPAATATDVLSEATPPAH